MNFKKIILPAFCLITAGALTIQSCTTYYFRSNYRDVNNLLHESENNSLKPYLKAHLKNGDVCILTDKWNVNPDQDTIAGIGSLYDYNRKKLSEGNISIPVTNVAIFETNQKLLVKESSRIAPLVILTAADIALGILCITNPKACFGSCPTFYLNENQNVHYADAEGFSNAVSPSLEYADIDALNVQFVQGNSFSINMKNEALETHCVNDLKLLAYPVNGEQRIYQSPSDQFYLCENNYRPASVKGPEGDITSLLIDNDKQERTSLADESDLSTKEEIYFDFENITNTDDLGLIISFRQTLMTTYFIYSAMGYSGDEVGDVFAKIETDGQTNEMLKNGIKKELGNIDCFIWNEDQNKWELQGGFYETGPIAINRQILPLRTLPAKDKIKIKVVLNKGLWSVDHLALTNIRNKVEPVEITPSRILYKDSVDSERLASLSSPDKYFISMPGDEFKISFQLPVENQNYDLFLYAKGYYLEWMRENWIKEKNLLKLRQMVQNPKKYLKAETKAYKLYEKNMVQQFWNSKIDTKTIPDYETTHD